jgi:type I restriction enzyme, S subunit
MSRINDLITELAPSNVEFHKIGDIAQVGTGSSDRNESSESGEYPFYVRSRDVLRIDSYEFDEAAIVIPGEGGIGEIFHYVCGKYALHQRAYRIRFHSSDVDTKFAYYYFSTHFKQFILSKAVNATVSSIRKPMITDFRIPAPPLEVQREIVKVLDAFTELETELETELAARQGQYGHFRRALLTPHARGRMMTIGDAFVMRAGQHLSATQIANIQSADAPYPCYGGNGIRGYVDRSSHTGRFLLVGRQGALCGNVKRATGEFYATEHAVVVAPEPNVDVDWAFHMLTLMDLNQYATKSAQPGLAVGKLETVPIAVPPIEEQRKIASILDKLDALVNDLSIGLPAELHARRQQYEHYRDRLLTFSEAE